MEGYTALQNPSGSYANLPQGVPQGTQTLCFAFSELFDAGVSQAFGYMAESWITYHIYPEFQRLGITLADFYPDYSFAGSIDRAMIGFLMAKNPAQSAYINQVFTASSHKRPDILVDNGILKEYYEIKPDSTSGRAEGRNKLQAIDNYMTAYGLPYTRGTSLRLPSHIKLGSFYVVLPGVGQVKVAMSLNLRIVNGLILYRICITTNWALLLSLPVVGIQLLLEAMWKFWQELIRAIPRIMQAIAEVFLAAAALLGIAFGFVMLIASLAEPTPAGEALAIALILAMSANFEHHVQGILAEDNQIQ